jgi:hypothetical protein
MAKETSFYSKKSQVIPLYLYFGDQLEAVNNFRISLKMSECEITFLNEKNMILAIKTILQL